MKIAVNGSVGRAKATISGNVDIGNLHLSDVLYLPSCDYNLISLVRLFKEGYDLECHYPLATISKNGVTYGHARKGRQGFLLLDNPVKPIVMNVTAENSSTGLMKVSMRRRSESCIYKVVTVQLIRCLHWHVNEV